MVEVEALRQLDRVAAVFHGLDVPLLGLEGVEARRRHEDLVSRLPVDRVLEPERVVQRVRVVAEPRPGPLGRAVQVQDRVPHREALGAVDGELVRVPVAREGDDRRVREGVVLRAHDELAAEDEDVGRVQREVADVARELEDSAVDLGGKRGLQCHFNL